MTKTYMKKLIIFVTLGALLLITPFSVFAKSNNILSQDKTQNLLEQTHVDSKLLTESDVNAESTDKTSEKNDLAKIETYQNNTFDIFEYDNSDIAVGEASPISVENEHNVLLSSSTTPARPNGWLDSVTTTSISGWAWRSDIPNTPIDVHIYIRNSSGQDVSVFVLTANKYRSDLASAGFGNGYHGFSMTINWVDFPPGTYYVTAYAISHNGVSNPQLKGCPISYTVRPCRGYVEYVISSMISGWVWKPDAPNTPIRAHIYIKRVNGSTINLYSATADIYREDLASGGYGNGCHIFVLTMDWDTLPKEELLVEVYAVDGSGVHPKIYSGYYNNASPHGSITLYGIRHSDTNDRRLYYTSAVQNAISSIGVTGINGLFTEATATTALDKMKQSMIWTVHTHGTQLSVAFNHSEQGVTSFNYYDMYYLPSNSLKKERCIIYGTCYAGEGRESEENMVNITYEKGAMTVIGWTGTTNVDQMNVWLENFLIASGNGATILEAHNSALQAVRNEYLSELGGLNNIYIKGSTTQKLVS